MSTSEPSLLAYRVIVFRSGGLGDLLLTLPLLRELENLFEEVIMCVPSKYHFLISEFSNKPILFDLDQGETELLKLAAGSEVVAFWNDPAWIREWKELGAEKVHVFNPRPVGDLHFSRLLIEPFIKPTTRTKLNQIWFNHEKETPSQFSKNLWIHAGSGGVDKNLPLLEFIHLSEQWIGKFPQSEVFFSFGEADLELHNQFLRLDVSSKPRVKNKLFSSLDDFFASLRNHKGVFAGNDSGPSHLAAMLGLETHVWFCCTNPKVWSPLGPSVKIYQTDSPPSKIL